MRSAPSDVRGRSTRPSKPKTNRDTGRHRFRFKLACYDCVPLDLGETRVPLDDVRPDVADGGQNRDRSSKLNHGADVHQFDRIEYRSVRPRRPWTQTHAYRAAHQV